MVLPIARELGIAVEERPITVEEADDAGAAKVLDVALARKDPAPPAERARALATRAELAVALGDTERLRALRAENSRAGCARSIPTTLPVGPTRPARATARLPVESSCRLPL